MNIEKHKSTVTLSIALGSFLLFLISLAALIIKSTRIQGSLFEKDSDYLPVAIGLGIPLIGGIIALYFYFSFRNSSN